MQSSLTLEFDGSWSNDVIARQKTDTLSVQRHPRTTHKIPKQFQTQKPKYINIPKMIYRFKMNMLHTCHMALFNISSNCHCSSADGAAAGTWERCNVEAHRGKWFTRLLTAYAHCKPMISHWSPRDCQGQDSSTQLQLSCNFLSRRFGWRWTCGKRCQRRSCSCICSCICGGWRWTCGKGC